MSDGGNKQFADHVVHELRHVLVALRATKRMLARGTKEVAVMTDLQLQSIERVQKLIEDCGPFLEVGTRKIGGSTQNRENRI